MGYKKYSPFIRSMKILMLVCFMYLTTRLDAVKIPVTAKNFDYDSLPVYCGPSTKHFKCLMPNGTELCVPEAFKCKIKCSNDAELNCHHALTQCEPGQYQCKNSKYDGNSVIPSTKLNIFCISELNLCDGRIHCPLGDDENPSMCAHRKCSSNEFSCKSPGHCIAKSQVCDGHYNCRRQGLKDDSDEEKCVRPKMASGYCPPSTVRCGSDCKFGFYCDGTEDCPDGSDEENCRRECSEREISCDNKCLPASKKCDGKPDCSDASDESRCRSKVCMFSLYVFCQRSVEQCIPEMSVCDGYRDCDNGEDEVCKYDSTFFNKGQHWLCASGKVFIHKDSHCNGQIDCPDGSDERNCTNALTSALCPPTAHLCSGKKHQCVDIQEACSGKSNCIESQSDPELERKCKLLRSNNSTCSDNNGGCHQICKPSFTSNDGEPKPMCSCEPGWHVSEHNKSSCSDINECALFGSCSQLCENVEGSYKCTCRPGYRQTDSGSCVAHGAAKILYSHSSGINIIDSVTDQVSPLISGINSPKYIAYDTSRREVFFHTRDGRLGQVQIDGKNLRFIPRERPLSAIAYDWSRSLLFYAEPSHNNNSLGYVGVINTTSGHDAKLRLLDCPFGLAADPDRGLLYVTVGCSKYPGIYTLSMDGKRLQQIFMTNEEPGHLALDLAASPQRLFWINEQKKKIESIMLNGSDYRHHVHINNKPSTIYDVAAFEDNLYWNDFTGMTLHRSNKYNKSDHKVLVEDKLVLSVAVFHSVLQPRIKTGDCGKCSQICIAGKDGMKIEPTCLCDKDYILQRNGSCLPKEPEKVVKTKAVTNRSHELTTDNEIDGSVATTQTEADKVTEVAEIKSREQSPNIPLIAIVAFVVIFGIALIGFPAAFACIRCQDKHSISFESFTSSQESMKSNDCPMPKVNSRTPLTDCEINVDSGQV